MKQHFFAAYLPGYGWCVLYSTASLAAGPKTFTALETGFPDEETAKASADRANR